MSKFKGKKVLVVGFGSTGVAVARYMAKQGAKVMVTDLKQRTDLNESLKATADLKLEYELGGHQSATFLSAELIVVSPAVPASIKPLEEARAANVPIVSELELSASLIKEPIIAVSGTTGKSTVAGMLSEMVKADLKTAYVGGSSGHPLIHYVTEGLKNDYVIAEVSPFQLELAEKMVPSVAVFTNIESVMHERFQSFDHYIETLKRLLKLCERNSFVTLNHDNSYLRRFAEESSSKLSWFTKEDPMAVGGDFAENFVGAYFIPGSTEVIAKINGREERYDVSKMRVLGEHNKENVMAAVCAARSVGISQKAVQAGINEFRGIEHRLEFIRKKNGVFFFNDSRSLDLSGVSRALMSFKKSPIILIAGGKDNNTEFGGLSEMVRSKCKMLILLGEAKERMNRAIGDFAETYLVGTFEEAILLAYQKSRSGDIILLSPGCPSHDMFRTFEERGEYFKKLVGQL